MLKNMPHELRSAIKMHIKNKLDIAELIKGYQLEGEDLSGAVITFLDVADENISRCNFADAVVGTPSTVVNFNRVIAKECCFFRTTFPGKVLARQGDFRNSNFKGTFMPYVDYKYADMRNCNFCDCVFSIGSQKSYGAMFSEDFFKDLAQHWGVNITITSMERKNG